MASSKQSDDKAKQGGQQEQGNSERGFASMDPKRQREIASEGGRAAHASGNAHEFSSNEARKAGEMSHGGQQNQSGGGGSGARQQEAGSGGSGGRAKSQGSGGEGKSTRGGTPEQHAEAGRQSHKNDR